MFDLKRIQRDFSDAAERYDAQAEIQAYALSRLLFKVQPLTTNAMAVLDAGCGTGRLAGLWREPKIVQLDLAYGMCAKAAANAQQSVNGTIEMLPFADCVFDVAFSALTLQWVPDWQAAMEEMRRVLKPGGVLAIATLGPATLSELRQSFLAADAYTHVSTFTPREAFSQTEEVTQHYEDLSALMRHLKTIGARHKMRSGRKGLMTRAMLARAEAYYEEHFREESGLAATWEILYQVERKP